MAHEYGHEDWRDRPRVGQTGYEPWPVYQHPASNQGTGMGPAALPAWLLGKAGSYLGDRETWFPLERQRRLEAQAAAVGPKMDQLGSGQYVMPRDMDAERREADMRRFRAADVASMTPEVKAKMLTGGYDPVVEEEDEYASLLRMMFFKSLLDQPAGGDPPTPYTVQAGPAARAFPTMPSMMA